MSLPAAPTFAEMLVTKEPRERSGPRSSNRFSFQHSWALQFMLQRHLQPGDYCVLLDVHEDVFVLDDSVDPKSAHVYQIKTDAATWTAFNLTFREKGKDGAEKSSVLGKLYFNFVQFPGCIASMTFVATAAFNIPMAKEPACGERESFGVMEIADKERLDIHAKIAKEHAVTDPPDGHKATYLLRSTLSVQDHERHTEGIISDFLAGQGDGTIPAKPFFRTIQSELRRKNDKEGASASFADLAKKKGLSRNEVQAMIDKVPSDRKMNDLSTTIRNQLTQERYNLRHQGVFNEEVRNYLAKRLDVTNLPLAEAGKRAAKEVAALDDAIFNSQTPIADIIAKVSAVPADEFKPIRATYSETFFHALIAVAIYEHQLPKADPQPKKESP